MSTNKKNADTNYQDHPHQEGEQNNTPSGRQAEGSGKRNSQTQQMSSMKQESDEQKAGPAHDQKDKQPGTR
jgi:hypothetical protein